MFNWLNKDNLRKYKKGETILEVLIALVVITIGAATATSLIITAIKANLFNKDSLVAINLAQEGIEYMRNIRDTNWIKFSANTQGCWNTKPGSATCSAANLIAQAAGTSGYALGNTLSTTATGIKLDLSNGVAGAEADYLLKYFDLNTLVNSDGINKNDIGGKPATEDDYDFIGSFYDALVRIDNSKFYRSIEVDYKNIGATAPWAVTPAVSPATADMMVVTSTVQWADGAAIHQVKLSSALSRYK
jgi:Tfp pilus assembly protein PilV